MNDKQRAALEKLRAMNGNFPRKNFDDGTHCFVTGINTTLLYSLSKLGHIKCSAIYLRGHTSTDLKVN